MATIVIRVRNGVQCRQQLFTVKLDDNSCYVGQRKPTKCLSGGVRLWEKVGLYSLWADPKHPYNIILHWPKKFPAKSAKLCCQLQLQLL